MNGDVKYVQSIVKLYWIIGFIKKDKKVDRVILPFLFATSWNGANRSVVVPRRREFIAVIDRATDGLNSPLIRTRITGIEPVTFGLLWSPGTMIVQKGAFSWCSQRAVRGDPHRVWTCVVYSVDTLYSRQFFML